MQERSYRLAQYEIILESSGGIWWRAHGGFANTKSGRCFVEGEVLFLGPAEVNEPGFLKGEFLEYLQQFPPWDGTRYYCPSYTLYACEGGRMLGYSQHPGLTGPGRDEAAPQATAHPPAVSDPGLPGQRGLQTGLRFFSSASATQEGADEREPLPSEHTNQPTRRGPKLSSLSPAANIRHMKGKLRDALHRCKALVGLGSGKDDSDQ